MDFQQKLKRTFLITFALLMGVGAHYFQHNQGGSGLELAQNNVVWIFFSILIGLGLWNITELQKIFYSRFTLLFLGAITLFCIPILYPNNELADQSYTRLFGLLAGFLLFFSLQQFTFNRVNMQRLLLLIVLAGFLQACYSLMQDYLLPVQNIFGYDVGYGRPYGIFQQPNVLASLMATTLILSGYLLQQINGKKLQGFLLITALLNMWVITVAMSRTGYLGVLIALLLLIPWAWQTNKKRFSVFILSILLGLGFASLKGDALGARNLDNMREGGARIDIYSHSWNMIKDKPLMGYGYGSFEKNYLLTHAIRVKNNELPPSPAHLTHPHNDTLYWAVEGGIIPLLAILLLIFAFIRLLTSFKLPEALALTSLVIPIVLHTQTEYPLYHSALHWLVLIVLVFYIAQKAEKTETQTFNMTFAIRVSALLIPMITALFMISNLYTISKITTYERNKQPNIELLLDIINPLVFENRLNFHFYYYRLLMALQKNSPDELQQVIQWAEDSLKKEPQSYFYLILYIAYINDQQAEKADEILQYARYLYPLDKGLATAKESFSLQSVSSANKSDGSNGLTSE